jgi:hypothetical protein
MFHLVGEGGANGNVLFHQAMVGFVQYIHNTTVLMLKPRVIRRLSVSCLTTTTNSPKIYSRSSLAWCKWFSSSFAPPAQQLQRLFGHWLSYNGVPTRRTY